MTEALLTLPVEYRAQALAAWHIASRFIEDESDDAFTFVLGYAAGLIAEAHKNGVTCIAGEKCRCGKGRNV